MNSENCFKFLDVSDIIAYWISGNLKIKHKFSPSYVSLHHTKGAGNNISEDGVEKQWRVEKGAVKCCLLEVTHSH